MPHLRLAAVLFGTLAGSILPLSAATLIAIPQIGFSDSSDEARDQTPEHAARLDTLTHALREGIHGPALEGLALPCEANCALDAAGVEQLRHQAGKAGAGLLLVGKVHKMSTLVLSMRVGVLDVASGKLVWERLLSFRGDNDEGWRRAGSYVARDIVESMGAPPK